MPSLQITAICIGDDPGVGKDPVWTAEIGVHGLNGDRHATQTVRIRAGKRRGETIFNERQWSAVSEEEIREIEKALGVAIPVGALGENFRVEGQPALSQLPFGTRIRLPNGPVLLVSGQNFPCQKQSDYLAGLFEIPTLRRAFMPASKDLRGIVGWVETTGPVTVGDRAVIELPQTVAT